MKYSQSEIEKLVIHLTDNNNVIYTFPLERQNNDDSIIWRFQDEQFEIEIITDKEIRITKLVKKSDTIVESEEEICQKFADSAFETKMNSQIKNKGYVSALKEYKGNILLVGINYEKKSRKHQCRIEKVEL